MSLSLSFKPLPTLHACQSVPIEWTYGGNVTAQGQGEGVMLVFVSASASLSQSSAVTSSSRVISTSTSTPPRTSTTSSRPSSTSSSSRPLSTPSPSSILTTSVISITTSRTIARRAPAQTPLAKTITTVPLSYTSIGWSPIALPSGTYDLSAYLVGTNDGKESIVGSQKGVMVIQGSETGCLAAQGSTTSSSPISAPTSAISASSSAQATGLTSNASPAPSESSKSSNKAGLIGGIVGAVLGILLLSAIAFLVFRRRRRQRGTHQILGTPQLGWLRRGKKDRGIGSAYNYDFGTLGSGAGGPGGDSSRRGTGGMSQVSGPMDVTHHEGLGAGFRTTTDQDEKSPEKGGETYGMVPVLARGNTDQSFEAGYVASPSHTRGYRPSSGGMEVLASAAPMDSAFMDHGSASDFNAAPSQHDRNPSDTSYTTSQSHLGLLTNQPIAFPTSEVPADRRASVGPTAAPARDPQQSIGRRSSGTPSTYNQRRKSSTAGGGVERSGSVRRKPVPMVEAFEDSPVPAGAANSTPVPVPGGGVDGGSPEVDAAGQRQGIAKQKSFVLDVDRPLER